MTPEQLAEIKARRAAVVSELDESNWYFDDKDMSVDCIEEGHTCVVADVYVESIGQFIAHAPTDIDALIAEVERLTLDLEEANEIRSAIDGEYSHAFEVYYDIQDRYSKKRAALKKPD